MDKMPQDLSKSNSKRTPLGGGKRSRKEQCKLAAQIRWQCKSADQQLSELQVENVSEHVLSAHGEATTSANSSSADLHAGHDNVPLPDEQDDQCTARRKLDLMRKYVGEADDTDSDKERCFMEIRCLKSLFSAVACNECGGNPTVAFGEKMGYSREIRLACEECTFTKQQYSCSRLDGSDNITVGFGINDSMVMCFNELGCGEAALRKFSAIMSIPGFAHNTYRRLSKKVGGAHAEVSANVLCAAVHAVHNAYVHGDEDDGNSDVDVGISGEDDDVGHVNNSDVSESSDVEDHGTDSNQRGDTNNDGGRGSSDDGDPDSDGDDGNGGAGIVDITVSFDGTWHKRGFTSNYGVGIVIDVSTGLVLDFEVLSKYCQACALHSNREVTEAERGVEERACFSL